MKKATTMTETIGAAARHCFLLRVRPERIDDYVRDHERVWPEMQAALRRAGWGDYSLFLDRSTGLVVGVVTSDDFEGAQRRVDADEVNTRWQESMAGYFLPVDDRVEPGALVELEQYFHLE